MKHFDLISKYLKGGSVNIPEEHRTELSLELLHTNIKRDTTLSFILPIISFILLCIDINMYNALQKVSLSFKLLFWTHMTLILIPVIFLCSLKILGRKDMKNHYTLYKTIHVIYVTVVLALCSFLSIYANLIHQHIFPYYIAIFCVASVLILNPYESIPIYLVSNIILTAGFIFTESVYERVFQTVLFSTFLSVVAIIISYINYTAYVNNFYNRKLLQQKTTQVDSMYKMAEEMLKKRTEELTEANNLLISKIKSNHEMEIEIIKTQRLYEEKDKILNQTIENEKLRTAFFANISHELRTPLTLIYSSQQMLDLLLKDTKDSQSTSEIGQYMRIIKQNCYRLLRLISNLIDITKIDAGYFQINSINCDIVRTVEDITMSVAKYIEDKNINLIFDTDIEEKLIAFDPDKMERIILNLLSNSVKFTPEGGNICVNINDQGDRISISVKDSGIGIPEEMKELIFQRFIQVDNTTTRNREGSGIGLALVKSLVEMHGGNISVSSKLGEGSEFTVEIPCTVLPNQSNDINFDIIGNNYNVEKVNIEFSDIYM